ncbi:MAG: 2-C-methyl-D-erythritol 2,4-cyclodiphosphate synthase [Leptospiraceae bacterium]|nr:2-C-methyl-D-erythritol 2,4-cyclodiphosphate synthase [Leptospiraceae bacterium]
MYRVGNGIDFHKLEINSERPLILGGYNIDSEYALVGHSDADIILHAISDAILGALSLGDIGDLFPDTDPSLKNLDSKKIIYKCLELMKEKDYELVNIDSTVICERPKIAPHRKNIQESIANVCGIQIDSVSVKATTTEKMGSLGRKEGVCVFSTVLLVKKT